MTVSPSIPTTIEMRRSRLAGLVVAVAVAAIAITWTLLTFVVDTGDATGQTSVRPTASTASLTPSQQRFVKGLGSMAQAQQSASVLYALRLGPQERQYVQGITSLTPSEQAAAFGRSDVQDLTLSPTQRFAEGIGAMAQAQQNASVLYALGLGTRDREYVHGVTSLTPNEQAAAFGGNR